MNYKKNKLLQEYFGNNEKLLQLLCDSAQHSVFIIDKDFRVVYANYFAAEQINKSPEEIVGKSLDSILNADASAAFKKTLREVFQTAKQVYSEDKVELPAGKVWLSTKLIPIKDRAGRIKSAMGIAHDITQKKHTEEGLKIMENAIASSINGIGITDLKGKVVYVNDSLVKMWGYSSKNEILGKNFCEFWEGNGILKTVKALHEKGGLVGEDTGKRKDGSLFATQFSTSMIKDQAGKPLYMFGSFVDTTKRKHAEEELEKSRMKLKVYSQKLEKIVRARTRQLRKLVESQKEFIVNIKHEVRTPLSTIKAVVEGELDSKNPPLKKQLVLINSKVDQITDTLKNLMLISRLDIGQEKINKTKLRLRDVIAEVLSDVFGEEYEESTKFPIKLHCSKEIELISDQTKIAAVLTNLIENADKYSNGKALIVIKAKRIGKNIRISVEDKNHPIPKKDLKMIFEKFYRVKHIKSKRQGLGLGLYICKKLVELLEGRIWAQSKKGSGNTFVVELPLTL